MHCLQRVKWKIGPVYIFLFLFFGAFFIILPFTVLHSAAKHPLMYCPGWFGEVRWASFMHHLTCSILFSSFLWDVRRLVLWIDFVEKEGLMGMEKKVWFFFVRLMRFFFHSRECGQILCIHMINSIFVIVESCAVGWFQGVRLNRLGDNWWMKRWFWFCDWGDISDTVAKEQRLYFHTQKDGDDWMEGGCVWVCYPETETVVKTY